MAINKNEICFMSIFENRFVFRLLGGRRQAEMGKEWGSGWAAKADWRGEGKRCFGAVGRLGEFLVWGRFGGSKSHLRRLSLGLVTASSRFCREEGNGGALFFPSDFERERFLFGADLIAD